MKKVKRQRIFPLGVKLAIIIGFIVLASLGSVTVLNSYFVSKDVRVTAEENNLTLNTRSASSVQSEFNSVRANVLQLLDLVNAVSGGRNSALAKQAEGFFFERNSNIAEIMLLTQYQTQKNLVVYTRLKNNRFYSSNEIDADASDVLLYQIEDSLLRACNGETIVENVSPFFKTGMLSLLLPYRENGLRQCCVIVFSLENIASILGTGSINETFMINDADELLCHPENDRILSGQSMKNHPLVKIMRQENMNNEESRQIVYDFVDNFGKTKKYIGAFQKIGMADISIFTSVSLDVVLEGVYTTRRNNLYLMAIVFFISIIFILSFSRFAISRHLRRLTAAAEEIQKGNFNTEIISALNVRRRDEIGILNKSTQDEQEFLNTFARFTNRGVAKAIARKEIDFEPHLKDVTIFFSDIRGFTAISDGFKNRFGEESPREIIGFLNDYMGRMVNCVTISGGTIDKFEGDAIMAVWGILRDDSLDFEQLPDSDPEKKKYEEVHLRHVKEDAVNAIRGTIAMRYALMEYNKAAEAFTKAHEHEERAKYKPHIRIGCGINTGRATCGIMGSEDKMEYTAIGDSVNFASRTESSNKPCGTDILITEDTYNLLKKDFIRCKENNFTLTQENEINELVVEQIPVEFEVKGKGAQHFYGVVNMPQFDIEAFFKTADKDFVLDADCARAVGKSGPKTLNEMRQLLGIPVPEFETVNLNEEENKIQVKK
ncbi:adenylate/guanylate cyclase domain-containing protein [Treponema sp.]|uniref:adenylate/guanylate cyclase domain-containing protein n=1 Tax=Treponema sp. TaxID=166 RepID=UPI00257D1744|nr:adenylate/guanylate cyclase domain-containing protein [Treponema sp.]MBE6354910.1 adenylate/guanylate cyclase domain-containing protein [Treponema sp.]